MKKVLCRIGFHKWVYFMGEWFMGNSSAWHRGCENCKREEISIETGNSFLYSENDAKNRLNFKTKEDFKKQWDHKQAIINSFKCLPPSL